MTWPAMLWWLLAALLTLWSLWIGGGLLWQGT